MEDLQSLSKPILATHWTSLERIVRGCRDEGPKVFHRQTRGKKTCVCAFLKFFIVVVVFVAIVFIVIAVFVDPAAVIAVSSFCTIMFEIPLQMQKL